MLSGRIKQLVFVHPNSHMICSNIEIQLLNNNCLIFQDWFIVRTKVNTAVYRLVAYLHCWGITHVRVYQYFSIIAEFLYLTKYQLQHVCSKL